MNEQLKKYIEEARTHNMSDDKIKENLLNAGWPQFEIDKTFDELDHPSEPVQIVSGPGPADTTSAAVNSQPAVHTVQARSKTLTLVLTAVIVLAALVAGGYFAYAKLINSPERVWKQANLNKVFGVRAAYRGKEIIKVSGKDLNGKEFKGELTNTAELDLTGKDKLSNNKLSVSFSYQGLNFAVEDIELRMIGKTVYANVSKLPYIGDLAKDYDGWIQMEGPDADSFNADLEKMIKSIEGVNFVKFHESTGKEKINGIDTYHYQLSIEKNALAKVINTYLDSSLKSFAKGAQQLTEEQVKQVKELLAKIIEHINIKNADVWIGLKDKQLHKAVLNAEYNDTDTLKSFASSPIQISFVGAYSHFNEKVKVSPPAKSLDILKDDIIKEMDSKAVPTLPPGRQQDGVK